MPTTTPSIYCTPVILAYLLDQEKWSYSYYPYCYLHLIFVFAFTCTLTATTEAAARGYSLAGFYHTSTWKKHYKQARTVRTVQAMIPLSPMVKLT